MLVIFTEDVEIINAKGEVDVSFAKGQEIDLPPPSAIRWINRNKAMEVRPVAKAKAADMPAPVKAEAADANAPVKAEAEVKKPAAHRAARKEIAC